jgi:PIN like domain
MDGRTVRRFLADLGYAVHTPTSVFGRERLVEGLQDKDWLPVVGANGWVVFCRDQHILQRDLELEAYLAARVHMFMLPGTASRQQILELLTANLRAICSLAVARKPNVYWLTPDRVVDYEYRRADLSRKRSRRA